MADGEVHKNNRKLTIQVMTEYGMGRSSIENIVNLEIQVLLSTLKVIFSRWKYSMP